MADDIGQGDTLNTTASSADTERKPCRCLMCNRKLCKPEEAYCPGCRMFLAIRMFLAMAEEVR